METEIRNFIKIWSLAIASATYSFCLSSILHIPPGILRFFFILPIIFLFTILPLSLSSFHLAGPTIFFLVWLANFKLILYSFNLGPLSTTNPNNPLSLLQFIAIALLPIKVNSQAQPTTQKRVPLIRSVLFGVVKLMAFALVVKIYDYRDDLPIFVLLLNFCSHLYLGIEVTLAVTAALVRVTLGMGLDPQFNEPYLATSLQDFWGRRWNLMVSDILRLSVFEPVRRVATPLVGRSCANLGGIFGAFIVSGLMHELIFFYFTRVKPTWEVTWFFVLHGLCTAVEGVAKKAVRGKFRLPPLFSRPLTLGFLGVTAWWLFLPQILRNGVDVKVINEYPIMFSFVKENLVYFFRK